MFEGNSHHYTTCGASALNAIAAAVQQSGITLQSIPDFGSGAGRVTRWLRAYYPEARLSVTDIRIEDLEFCAREFGANYFPSSTDVTALHSKETYDLIWAGSVLTHLPEEVSKALIQKLSSWLTPNGVLVMSFHGRFAALRGPYFGNYGLETEWTELLFELSTKGFAYSDYPHQRGYGISLSTLEWVTNQIQRIDGARLVFLAERAWDDHQDVFGFQLRPISERL